MPVVAAAEHIVGVCEASPRGLLRFLDWLSDVDELAPEQRVHVAVNRTPRAPFRQGELQAQLHEHAGPRLASLTFLPEDAAVSRAAWDGVVVGRSRIRRAIEELAAKVAPEPAPRRRLRAWR